MSEYRIHHIERTIYAPDGARFDPATRSWTPGQGPARGKIADATTAVTWLQRESGHPLRIPIAVVGARDASPPVEADALALGRAIARMGFTVVTGEGGGVADAASKGVETGGGNAFALVAGHDDRTANEHASLVFTTGAGDATPVILASMCLCMIAIGDGVAAMPECQAALRAGKRLVLYESADEIAGALHAKGIDEALAAIADCALRGRDAPAA